MFFKATNNKLLKKLLKKFSSLTVKEFDSNFVYGNNNKYIKSKIKSYEKINKQTLIRKEY